MRPRRMPTEPQRLARFAAIFLGVGEAFRRYLGANQ